MTFSPIVIAVLLITVPVPAAAQEAGGRDPLETVVAPRTGSGEDAGLLPVAIAAAWRVVEAARDAARAADDWDAMQRHARRVLAAVDPALAPGEPACGDGAGQAVAAARAAMDMGFAADAGAADVLRVRTSLAAAADAVEQRLSAVAAAAHRVLAAPTAAAAAGEAATLRQLAEQVVFGVDADSDDRVTVAPGEAGLVQWRVALRALLAHRAVRTAETSEVGR